MCSIEKPVENQSSQIKSIHEKYNLKSAEEFDQ